MPKKAKLLRHAAILGAALAALTLALAAVGPGIAGATSAANTALINGDTVIPNEFEKEGVPISLEQFAAEQAGFAVTVATGEEWTKMSSADFAKYQVLIIGDPHCNTTPTSVIESAPAWTPAVMATAGGNTEAGNRTLIGTDPEYHYPSHHGAEHLVQDGIAFAGAIAGATGGYVDVSCEDPGSDVKEEEIEGEVKEVFIPGEDVTKVLDNLTATGPGHWSENPNPPCGGSVQQIAEIAAFSTGESKLEDSDIQGWSCSVHVTFPTFPADWNPVAVATDTKTKPTCGTDPSTKETACGEAYVLVSGGGVVATSPNLTLELLTGESKAGGTHAVTATVVQEPEPVLTSRAARSGAELFPVPGAVVTFAVTGRNTGVAGTCTYPSGEADPECKTDANGKVVFTYPDTNGAGTDTINASVTLRRAGTQHATAAWTWTPVPATPAPAPVTTTTAAAQVLASKVAVAPAKGTARAASIRGCLAQSSYLASVAGTSIASVTFTLDGHAIKTLRKPTSGSTFAARVRVRSGSAHHLAMRVGFTSASKTPTATFRRTLARCAVRKAALPRFTG
jgi:hypothetical protein